MNETSQTIKDWGYDNHIFSRSNVNVRGLVIFQGKKSSYGNYHVHKFNTNIIYVHMGVLRVFRRTENKKELITDLTVYESIIINPGVYHRFEALDLVYATEIYFADVITPSVDIIREQS